MCKSTWVFLNAHISFKQLCLNLAFTSIIVVFRIDKYTDGGINRKYPVVIMNSTGSQQTKMASKSKGKQRGEDIEQEDVFQAVVIADSFNVRFAPITNEKPKVISRYFYHHSVSCWYPIIMKHLMQLSEKDNEPEFSVYIMRKIHKLRKHWKILIN